MSVFITIAKDIWDFYLKKIKLLFDFCNNHNIDTKQIKIRILKNIDFNDPNLSECYNIVKQGLSNEEVNTALLNNCVLQEYIKIYGIINGYELDYIKYFKNITSGENELFKNILIEENMIHVGISNSAILGEVD